MYVLGGRNRVNAARLPEYETFEAALILRLADDGAYEATEVEYHAAADAAPPVNPLSLFKAGTLAGDTLHVCTHGEVMAYRVPDFALVNYISLPAFNDLHHVRPDGRGSLFVADTGLDAVLQLTEAGKIVREWDISGGDLWTRFSRATDYRQVGSTKPHLVHPNYIFLWRDELWVTRLEQRDAMRILPTPGRIAIEVERPHDGIVLEDKVYFTTVDGHLVRADLKTHEREFVYDLQELAGSQYPLGWCRGLKLIDADRAIVGFSRLRPTRFIENVAWVKKRIVNAVGIVTMTYNFLPTRVGCFDLSRKKLLWETNLEPFGMNAVFAVL